MTIYVPLLYICMAGQCGFFQSENYTTDEQNCEQEIANKKAEYTSADVTVKAICIDIKLERKKDEFKRQFQPARNDQIRNSIADGI